MKNISTLSLSSICLFAIAIALVGCTTVPQEELEAAQSALQAADSAEADIYVADLYQAATDSFTFAQQEIEAKNFERAESLLTYVALTATEAKNQVEPRKDEMRISNETLLIKAEQAIAQLNFLISETPHTEVVSTVSYQEDATAATADLEAAKAAQASTNYAHASELAQSALAKANALIEEMNAGSIGTPPTPRS